MNLLKSIFISGYMTVAMVLAGYAAWKIQGDADPLAWAGVLLTSAPIVMTIGWLMMFRSRARTSAHFPVLHALALLGAGSSAWAWLSGGAGVDAFVLALVGWAGFVAYAYWYSSFGGRRASARLEVGAPLPRFTVKDVSGALVSSAQLTDRPAVLIFFRGNWCPLCMAQVKELVGRYQELRELGVRVALIAPQPHANTQALAQRFDVPFEFLTDEAAAAARILGINHKNGLPMGMQMLGYDSETVLPTVIITDGSGKVVWTHETDNYRVRPEPDTYLEILRKHGVLAAARV